jgi:hypothetical protein
MICARQRAGIRQALRGGLPDKENHAAAFLQLCSIMMTKRVPRCKDSPGRLRRFAYYPQIVDQIKQVEKYISRILDRSQLDSLCMTKINIVYNISESLANETPTISLTTE